MKAEELVPEEPKFYLKSRDKEFTLSIPRFHQALWLSKQGDLKDLIEESNWPKLCQLVYFLLIEKSEFIAKKEKTIDENGFEIEHTTTGPELLFEAIDSADEAAKMLGALFSALVASNPVAQQQLDDLKKNQKLNQTGGKFSTSLPQSTGTPQENLKT